MVEMNMVFSSTHGSYFMFHPIHGKKCLHTTGKKVSSAAGMKEAERKVYATCGSAPGTYLFNWLPDY